MVMKPDIPSGNLLLVSREIDVNGSGVLFDEPVTRENIDALFEFHNSEWFVENGWLTGKNPDESAGMAIFRRDFPGNVMLEFDARTVLPSTRDINFMWNTEWSDSLNSCGNGYIGSICGWWTKRAGIEKSPDFKLRATTAGFEFEPGRTYKVQAGGIDGDCFVFIDGKLFIELSDPDPVDNTKYCKIALSAYSSHVQFKNIKIRQIRWKHLEMSYTPEF
jgi:hypothetical protein